jgi:hypothetical protein
MKRGFWVRKIVMILLCAAAAVLLFGFIVMNLWNAILPTVLHVSAISFWQAVGLLVLSKILFGGFRGGWGGGPRAKWKERMQDKWKNMTPEERDRFKQEWRNRCAGWRRPSPSEKQAVE